MTLKTHARSVRKCPFCRTAIKSKALNISLQDLIRTSNEQKKPEAPKPLTLKEAQKMQNECTDYYIPSSDAEAEIVRKEILLQEQAEIREVSF